MSKSYRMLSKSIPPGMSAPSPSTNAPRGHSRGTVLRIDVPFGALTAPQLRAVAGLFRRGHVVRLHCTTRQNVELHLADAAVRDGTLRALETLGLAPAGPGRHAFASPVVDPLAGVANDEEVDPKPLVELVMDWARVTAVFYGLPAKLKVGFSGAQEDRVGVHFQDVGVLARHSEHGEARYDIFVGGGLGRKPRVGELRASRLSARDVLAFLHALVVVYAAVADGVDPRRRRLGATVERIGDEAFFARVRAEVERAEWDVDAFLAARSREGRTPPKPRRSRPPTRGPRAAPQPLIGLARDRHLAAWLRRDVLPEANGDYASVRVAVLGDDPWEEHHTAVRLEALGAAVDSFGDGSLWLSVRQDGWIRHVPRQRLVELHRALTAEGVLGAPGSGSADVVACPGAPVCAKSNASSFDVAGALRGVLRDVDAVHDLGVVRVGVSACMNGCGLHHASDIGLMGVSKRGEPHFQVSVGGHTGEGARLGTVIGPAMSEQETLVAVRAVLEAYLRLRDPATEPLHQTFHRVGESAFLAAVRAVSVDRAKE